MGDPRHLLRDDQLPWLQAEWDATQRGAGEFCLYLGRQCGKTHYGRYRAIRGFLSGAVDPASRTWVPGNVAFVSKSQRSTKDIAKDIFDRAFRDAPTSLGIRWIAHENRFVCANGGSLWIFGLESGASISRRGNVYTLVIVDEAAHIAGLVDIVGSVLGAATLKRDALILYLTTPPENPGSSWYEIKARCMAEGAFLKRATTEDPTISEYQLNKLAKKLGGRTSPKWKREVLCEDIAGDDALGFPNWGEQRLKLLRQCTPPAFVDRYEGLDLGFFPDFTALLLAWYSPECEATDHGHPAGERHCHVFREVFVQRQATGELARDIRHAEAAAGWSVLNQAGEWVDTTVKPAVLLRVGDVDPSKVVDLATDHGIVFSPTAKHNKGAQIGRVNDWLRNAWLTISPDCSILDKTLLAATRKVSLDGDATGEKWEWTRSKVLGHMDAADALIYLLRNIATEHNPAPRDARGPGDYLLRVDPAARRDTSTLDTMFHPKKHGQKDKVRWPNPRRLP
jgi:hypothetical protein